MNKWFSSKSSDGYMNQQTPEAVVIVMKKKNDAS